MKEPVIKEGVEDPDGESLNRFTPMPIIHVEKKDIFHNIAPRKEKSILDTSRQKQWSLIHRE